MPGAIHICSFGTDLPPGRDYAALREAVLKAGRFSVFDATENQTKAKLFDRLVRDPELVIDNSCGFPWTRVSRRG